MGDLNPPNLREQCLADLPPLWERYDAIADEELSRAATAAHHGRRREAEDAALKAANAFLLADTYHREFDRREKAARDAYEAKFR